MAFPVWPAPLPQLRGQLQGAGSPGLIPAPLKTAFDGGNSRTRRRYLGRPPTRLNMELELDLVTFPIFLAFVEDDLHEGVRPFTGPVLLPNGAIGTRTCQIESQGDGEIVPLRWAGPLAPRPSFVLLVWNWRP